MMFQGRIKNDNQAMVIVTCYYSLEYQNNIVNDCKAFTGIEMWRICQFHHNELDYAGIAHL